VSVTLTEALVQVRDLLDEPTAQFWTDLQLTSYINQGCAEVARKCEWKRAIADIAATAETQSYTGPADMYRAYRVDFVQSGTGNDINTYTLEWRGYMEMDQVWGINQQWPANYPLYYTTWGAPPTLQIICYPVPSVDGTLHVFYYQLATEAVSGSDNVDILEGFEDIIWDYACYRAWRQDSNPMWKDSKAIYEEKLQDLYDTSRTFQDQAGTFSTGQSALPAWLTSEGY
jgi:hypothetical protein